MTALHPIEERLRQRWGEQTTALVHTPAGRLWQVSAAKTPPPNSTPRDPSPTAVALFAVFIAAPAGRVTECLAKFAEDGVLLRNETSFLWPDRSLPDPTLPTLRYSLTGSSAVPLPVFMAQGANAWSAKRLCGQFVPLLAGLQALHSASKVHGAVSPLSIAVEQLGTEYVLRWMYTGLWSPLRELGISITDALGAGSSSATTMALPNPSNDIRQFGHILAWIRAHALSHPQPTTRWPTTLDTLISRCVSSTPPPCTQALTSLQDALASWNSTEESPNPSPIEPIFDPRTGASLGTTVFLPILGDLTPEESQISQQDLQDPLLRDQPSVAVRLPKYVGQGSPSNTSPDPSLLARDDSPPLGERDPDTARNQAMRSPDDPTQGPSTPENTDPPASSTSPPAKDKEDDEEEPTTMVLSRDRLSGLFASIEQQQAKTANPQPPEPATAPAGPTPPAPPLSNPSLPPPPPAANAPKPKGRGRRRKPSTRNSIEPENQVISVKHNLSQRGGLSSQPALLILIILLILAVVLLILLLLKPANAQPLNPPSGTSQDQENTNGKLRLTLASRAATSVQHAAVNPAGHNYATCTGQDVALWASQAPQNAPLPLLDRINLGGHTCAQLGFSADGLALFILTTTSSLLRYDISAARLDALSPPLEGVFFYDFQALKSDDLVLVGRTNDPSTPHQHTVWRWHITPQGAPSLAPQVVMNKTFLSPDRRLRRCEADSAYASAFQDENLIHLFFWGDGEIRSHLLTPADAILECAVSANGHRLSALIAGIGVQHWSLSGTTPQATIVFPAWEHVQSARIGSLLRYGGHARHLMLATRDRIISTDPGFAHITAALAAPQFSTLQGHQAWPLPDQNAALILRDGKARILSLQTGELKGEASYQLPWIHQTSTFSPDGEHILSLFAELGDAPSDQPGPSSVIAVWNLNTYTLTSRRRSPSWIRHLAITHRGDAVAAVTENLTDPLAEASSQAPFSLHIWPLPNIADDSPTPLPLKYIPEQIQWSSDGTYALLRSEAREHTLLRRGGDNSLSEVPIKISVNDTASLYQDHFLLVWSPETGLHITDLYGDRSSETLLRPSDLGPGIYIYDILTHASSRAVLLTGRGGGVWLMLPKSLSEKPVFHRLPLASPDDAGNAPPRAAFDVKGQRFVFSGAIYDSAEGLPRVMLESDVLPAETGETMPDVLFSADGRWLWRADLRDGRWDANTGTLDPKTPSLWATEAKALWGKQLGGAEHPTLAWNLRQSTGLARIEAADGRAAQGIELGLVGEDGWAMVSGEAFVANDQGRAFISLSNGNSNLELNSAQLMTREGATALSSVMQVRDWGAVGQDHALASWVVNYLARLDLTTTPEGAEVLLDIGQNKPLQSLGITPFKGEIPGPQAESKLVFRRPGYTPLTFDWLPGEDLTLNFELRELITDQEAPFVRVTSGPLVAEELLMVVQRNREQLTRCLEGRLQAVDPAEAELKIAPGGEVSSIEFSSSLTDAALTQCLRYAIMRWRFPTRPMESVVRYRFLLDKYALAPL